MQGAFSYYNRKERYIMIKNPILPGFNPDPCICRKENDYYLITSTFEWMPGLPVYHSKDLKNWELIDHILTDEECLGLKNLSCSKGIWAPCITYCEWEDMFYVVYGVMNSTYGNCFDVDNYVITSKSIHGPWSEPVYLHSAGFDASMYHEKDGRKWVVSLEWETREGYEKPGEICIAEYDAAEKRIKEFPIRIWNGSTDRGCIEAPHITKHGEYYYLMCAEGGTGYAHCVTLARSKDIYGPYEADPNGYIITSAPGIIDERHNIDYLKPRYYNPKLGLQKAGHGSYVELPTGEVYLFYHASRPFVPELRCTLGRETCIAKLKWTDDGWLRTVDDTSLASIYCPEPQLAAEPIKSCENRDDFDYQEIGLCYYSPRRMPQSFANTTERPGYLRIYGSDSPCSLNKVNLVAKKLTSINLKVTAKMDFSPKIYQHTAGLIIYYDNLDYIYLNKSWNDNTKTSELSIIVLENGIKTTDSQKIPVIGSLQYLRLNINGKKLWFEWSSDGNKYKRIGSFYNTSHLSDEYCKAGEFTGTMVGLICTDTVFHKAYADFDFFETENL